MSRCAMADPGGAAISSDASHSDEGCRETRLVDRDLLELALAEESDRRFWSGEFRWFLSRGAVAPLTEADATDRPLTVSGIAGQQALRFPIVSGDAQWLGDRSMAVLARRLAPLLAAGGRVAVDLSAVARDDAAGALRREQLRLVADGLQSRLPGALERFGIEAHGLLFSVTADHPGIGSLVRLSQTAGLGRPVIAIRVPDRLLLALWRGAQQSISGWPGDPLRFWLGLTELTHREPRLTVVLQHTTRPACPLAVTERPDAVMPDGLFEARAATAWLAFRVNLAALPATGRHSDLLLLRRLFRAGLRLADNLMDQLDWASPEAAQDALVNRRLAVHLTGIGDVADRLGLDPAAFTSVRLAARWIAIVRRLMVRESNQLARARGMFPALEVRDLESTLARSYGRDYARRLLRQAGLRHRHLLVLSPYDVFPRAAPRHPLHAYLHLLPALRCADTIGMYGHEIRRALPLGAYRRLLQMTWAIGQNRP